MKTLVLSFLFSSVLVWAGERSPVVPADSPKPIGPYTPGILTSRFLYVSGQGMNNSSGKAPETWDAQVRQCLDNVKSIVVAAGLGMANVVSTQVYVPDLKKWPDVQKIYEEYFPDGLPAPTLLEVSALPGGTLVEINAIAVVDVSKRKALSDQAVQAGSRVYLPAVTGVSRADAEGKLNKALASAGLKRSDVVFANEYAVGSKAPNAISVQALLGGAKYAISAIAVKGGGTKRSECTKADGALFCLARGGTGIAPIRSAITNLRTRMRDNGFAPSQVAASNIYLGDLAQFQAMNKVYGALFNSNPPARTTVQPVAPGGVPFRISVIAEQ